VFTSKKNSLAGFIVSRKPLEGFVPTGTYKMTEAQYFPISLPESVKDGARRNG
jgi:hypothetical protein